MSRRAWIPLLLALVAVTAIGLIPLWCEQEPDLPAPVLPLGDGADPEPRPQPATLEPAAPTAPGLTPPEARPQPAFPSQAKPAEPPALVVQVVDNRGAPRAGVPVEIAVRELDFEEKGRKYYSRKKTWDAVTEGPRGLARFSLPGADVSEACKKGDLIARIPIRARTPVKAPVPVWPATEPVRLILPATGSVEITVRQPDGIPWPGHAWVRLTWIQDDDREDLYYPARDGRAVIPHVGLGLGDTLCLEASACSFVFRSDWVEMHGPSVPGQRVSGSIRLKVGQPCVTGRVLGLDGQPLVDTGLTFQRVTEVDGRRLRGRDGYAETYQSGRFTLLLQPWTYRALRVRVEDEGRIVAAAEVSLTGPYSAGVHDLGDIRLQPVVLLAAGKVTGLTDQDVEARNCIRTWVELHPAGGEGDLEWIVRRGENDQVGAMIQSLCSPKREFNGLYSAAVTPDRCFEIRGRALAEPFELRARGWLHVTQIQRGIEPGRRDVHFALRRTGTLKGSLLVSESMMAEDFRVFAVQEGKWGKSTSRRVDRCGRFRLTDLSEGTYTVVVRLGWEGEEVARRFGVKAVSGKALSPPDLQRIDLRGRVRQITLQVRSPEGLAMEGVAVWSADKLWLKGRTTNPRGEATLPASAAPYRLVLWEKGYRPLEVENFRTDRSVVMKPGIPVRLLLDLGMPVPPDTQSTVFFRYIDTRNRMARFDPASVEVPLDTKFVDFIVEKPGPYEVAVVVGLSGCVECPVRFEVPESKERVTFRVRFPPEKIAAALADE